MDVAGYLLALNVHKSHVFQTLIRQPLLRSHGSLGLVLLEAVQKSQEAQSIADICMEDETLQALYPAAYQVGEHPESWEITNIVSS